MTFFHKVFIYPESFQTNFISINKIWASAIAPSNACFVLSTPFILKWSDLLRNLLSNTWIVHTQLFISLCLSLREHEAYLIQGSFWQLLDVSNYNIGSWETMNWSRFTYESLLWQDKQWMLIFPNPKIFYRLRQKIPSSISTLTGNENYNQKYWYLITSWYLTVLSIKNPSGAL